MNKDELCKKYKLIPLIDFEGKIIKNEYVKRIDNYFISISFGIGTNKAVSEITNFHDGKPNENYCNGYRNIIELYEHLKHIECVTKTKRNQNE